MFVEALGETSLIAGPMTSMQSPAVLSHAAGPLRLDHPMSSVADLELLSIGREVKKKCPEEVASFQMLGDRYSGPDESQKCQETPRERRRRKDEEESSEQVKTS